MTFTLLKGTLPEFHYSSNRSQHHLSASCTENLWVLDKTRQHFLDLLIKTIINRLIDTAVIHSLFIHHPLTAVLLTNSLLNTQMYIHVQQRVLQTIYSTLLYRLWTLKEKVWPGILNKNVWGIQSITIGLKIQALMCSAPSRLL